MSLSCLKPKSAQHKTTNERSLKQYGHKRKPCPLKYCESCIKEHSNTTWFEAIKWGRDFHCKDCMEDEEPLPVHDVPTKQWYADPRGHDNRNRGAVDDPPSQAGNQREDFYSFARRLARHSKEVEVVQDTENDDDGATRKRPLRRTLRSDAVKRRNIE